MSYVLLYAVQQDKNVLYAVGSFNMMFAMRKMRKRKKKTPTHAKQKQTMGEPSSPDDESESPPPPFFLPLPLPLPPMISVKSSLSARSRRVQIHGLRNKRIIILRTI